MIPRIIHQTWSTSSIPPHLAAYRGTWCLHHAGWEHRFWDDDANDALIARHYPSFGDYYRRAVPRILRVDLVRLAYLHRFGGVYADMDCEALRPVDHLLAFPGVVVARESRGIGLSMRRRDFILNAIMAGPAAHPLWLDVMERMSEAYRPRRAFERYESHVMRMSIACLDEAVEQRVRREGDVLVLDHGTFYPAPASVRCAATRSRLADACGAYAVHHYDNSWVSLPLKCVNRVRQVVQTVREGAS